MIDKGEWADRYVSRLIDRGVDEWLAESTYEAGLDDHDYESDPEAAADDELSYWSDDGVTLNTDYDPTPWCSYCHAPTPVECQCGPIAENE